MPLIEITFRKRLSPAWLFVSCPFVSRHKENTALLRAFAWIDQRLTHWTPAQHIALALFGATTVGCVDFLTGYEASLSLLYIGPLAVAAWYNKRWVIVSIALYSSIVWYIADTGAHYSYPAIPIWNALIRLGFFLVCGMLLAALHDSLRREQRLSRTDSLTGLSSRHAFEERFAYELASAQRRQWAITIAYIDLDNFKAINDEFGHCEGDRILQITGNALKQKVRCVDMVVRLGGDEFVLLLPNTNASGAQQIISTLNQTLRETLNTPGREITCSIGAVTFLDLPTSMKEAIQIADAVMYEVKRQGKANVAHVVRTKTDNPNQPHCAKA